MPSPSRLALALLPIALAATALAQSPAQSPAKPTPPSAALNPPAVHDSRNQVPAITPGTVIVKAPNKLAQNDSVCYALRTYEFTPTEPATGATTYKGQSTCVPAHTAGAMIVVAKPR